MSVKENEENIIKTMSKEEFLENVKSGKKVFYNIYFDSIDLSKLELHGIKFEKCVFHFADFSFCKLKKCNFDLCEFIDTDFSNLTNGSTDFDNCTHKRTNFSNVENFYLNNTSSLKKDNPANTFTTVRLWVIVSIWIMLFITVSYIFFKN